MWAAQPLSHTSPSPEAVHISTPHDYHERRHADPVALAHDQVVNSLLNRGNPTRKDVPMPKSHAPYPPEFRAEAIRLLRTSGKSMAQIGRELEVTTETLRQWLRRADIDDGLRHDGLTTEETEEVRRLRREVKTLREEREILLKAAAFFAKETGQTPR